MLTKKQIRERTKTVTRRLGWLNLKPGDHFMGCEQCQGIPKGGHVVDLGEMVCISNRRERLDRLLTEPEYGAAEVVKEGFPELTPAQFVEMFCGHMKVTPETVCNRIEIDYITNTKNVL